MSETTSDQEVMMPMQKPEALQHIEITVLRQMGENIAAQTRHLETLSGKIDDVRERVIRIEAKEFDKRVDILSKRVQALEALGNRVKGGASLGAWLAESAPWLLAGIMSAVAIFHK